MNPEQLKQLINFDYQLSTFAIGMHQFLSSINDRGSKLSLDLIDYAQKFGDFVYQMRKEGLSSVPTEEVK